MSIIVKPNINNINGSNSKGFAPDNASMIISAASDKSIWVKWNDPEDTIITDSIIVKWRYTTLVRNNNHYPENDKDGTIVYTNTIRNQYKDIWFKDSGLINGNTYYYRLFSYSDNGVCNLYTDKYTVFKETPILVLPTFSENTWEQINSASKSGSIPSTWNIGDEIDIQLSGDYNETVTLQIWDFNHFDKTDDTGKAGLVLGCKNVTNIKSVFDNDYSIDWKKSFVRTDTLSKIYKSLDQDLQKYIKEVYTPVRVVPYSAMMLSADKIFLPSAGELNYPTTKEEDGPEFPIFTDDNSRIKISSEYGYSVSYHTRTQLSGGGGSLSIDYKGSVRSSSNTYEMNICFCFCV